MSGSLDGDPFVAAHPQSRPFWEAAASGALLVPRCRACGRSHWYPRPFCPFCGADDVALEEASGHGTVHAFTAVLRANPPSILAYVALEEGPILLTNLVGCRLEEVAIGDPVTVEFRPAPEGRMVPVFTRAGVDGQDVREPATLR